MSITFNLPIDAELAQAVELSAQSGGDFTSLRCTASIRLTVTDKIYPDFIKVPLARLTRASRAAMRRSAAPR